MPRLSSQTFFSIKTKATLDEWPLQLICFRNYFLADFLAAHLAFISAESLALAAALITNFFFAVLTTVGLTALGAVLALAALILAQRSLAAAEMRALPAALISPFLLAGLAAAVGAALAPCSCASCFSNAAIFSMRSAAWRSWDGVRLAILMGLLNQGGRIRQ